MIVGIITHRVEHLRVPFYQNQALALATLKQNAGGAGFYPSRLRGANPRLPHRRPPA